jgi:hypothetical protein
MIFDILVTMVSIMIIICGHVGLNMVKIDCENVDPAEPQPPKEVWGDRDSVIKNEKILAITTGIGYGIFMFLIINLIDKLLKSETCQSNTYGFITMFGIFLIVVTSFMINQNTSTDSVCDKQISKNFNIIYGLLGFGIGVMLYSVLKMAFSTQFDKNKGITCKDKISTISVFIITAIILLTQSVTIVLNSNNCKNPKYDKKTPNTIGYIVASLTVLFILFVIVAMVLSARKGKSICSGSGGIASNPNIN